MVPRKALYLKDSASIASGDKAAFATAAPVDLSGCRALLIKTEDGGLIPGTVTVAAPEALDTKAFDAAYSQHGIAPQDRKRWWPGREELYLHRVQYEALEEPVVVDDFPAGITADVDLTGIVPVTVRAVVLERKEANDGYIYTYGVI